MTDKIKEAAAKMVEDWINIPGATETDLTLTAITSEAAREYWEGQKDKEIARLKEDVKELVEQLELYFYLMNKAESEQHFDQLIQDNGWSKNSNQLIQKHKL